MALSDHELREMVRESIARIRGAGVGLHPADSRPPSHQLLKVAAGSEGDGACLIEPAVRCNHCGYCQSYGH